MRYFQCFVLWGMLLQQVFAQNNDIVFNPLGPSNTGGRIDAILIDQDNPDRIYCGGLFCGLFISEDGGESWSYLSKDWERQHVKSIAQAPNGDIYVGTGSDFAPAPIGAYGHGSIGNGIYKSTNGYDFSVLPNTLPDVSQNYGSWSCVNSLAVDPNNSNIVYAATNRGVYKSANSGVDWELVSISTFGNTLGKAEDILVTNTGKVVVSINADIYTSPDGSVGSFNVVSTFANASRTEIDLCYTNQNVMYAVSVDTQGELIGLYKSIDMGDSWALEQAPVPGYWDESSGLFNGLGRLNLVLAVHPLDDEIVFIGGFQYWKYDGSLTKLANESGPDATTVFRSKFAITIDKDNPDRVVVGSEGGIDISMDGGYTNYDADTGLVSTNFYGVAMDSDGEIMGGAENHGTIAIDFDNPNPLEGFNGDHLTGEDGQECVFSKISNVKFASTYSQYYSRATDVGNFNSICVSSGSGPDCGAGSFYSQLKLWETSNNIDSSVTSSFVNIIPMPLGIGAGNGNNTSFSFTIPLGIGEEIVPQTVVVYYGVQGFSGFNAVTDSIQNGVLSGDGSGSINYAQGTLNATFNSAPAFNQPVFVTYKRRFTVGSEVEITSALTDLKYTAIAPANIEPLDTLTVTDPYRTMLVAGNENNGISISLNPIAMSQSVEWIDIQFAGYVRDMDFSADGNHLFALTYDSKLYRISNLSKLKSANDLDSLTITEINLGNTTYRGLAVDPHNSNNVVVSGNNYGSDRALLLCTNAVTTTGSVSDFMPITGNLPEVGLYDVLIDINDSNLAFVGSEYGLWYSQDFKSTNPTWIKNESIPNVLIWEIHQQRNLGGLTSPQGQLTLATYGNGIWRSSTLQTSLLKQNPKPIINELEFDVYPNPTIGSCVIEFQLEKQEEVKIHVFSVTGKLEWSKNIVGKVGLNRTGLTNALFSKGTYIIRIEASGEQLFKQLIKM